MTKEELCKFSDPDNPKICGPFSFGEYSYATNGHVLVRVPRLADVPEWKAINGQAAQMFDGLDYSAMEQNLVGIPVFDVPEPVKCYKCHGKGKVSLCPECDGEGEVDLDNEYHTYECECKTCDGEGSIAGNDAICTSCNGTGNERTHQKVSVGAALFSGHYLAMMDALGGTRIAVTETLAPAYFTFDGGDGLLMPMRA